MNDEGVKDQYGLASLAPRLKSWLHQRVTVLWLSAKRRMYESADIIIVEAFEERGDRDRQWIGQALSGTYANYKYYRHR